MAASNTDDRDDDVPRDDRRGRGDLPDRDVEARWADIVASLGDVGLAADGPGDTAARPGGPDAPSTAEPGSTSQDTPDEPSPPVADGGAGSPGEAAVGGDQPEREGREGAGQERRRSGGPRDWPASEEVEALDDAETHFTPPEPPPLLASRDPLLTMAWGFVVTIPVLTLLTVIVSSAFPSVQIPPLAGQLAVGLFLAGLGVLLWRMPHHRDPDDEGPGAVV